MSRTTQSENIIQPSFLSCQTSFLSCLYTELRPALLRRAQSIKVAPHNIEAYIQREFESFTDKGPVKNCIELAITEICAEEFSSEEELADEIKEQAEWFMNSFVY